MFVCHCYTFKALVKLLCSFLLVNWNVLFLANVCNFVKLFRNSVSDFVAIGIVFLQSVCVLVSSGIIMTGDWSSPCLAVFLQFWFVTFSIKILSPYSLISAMLCLIKIWFPLLTL